MSAIIGSKWDINYIQTLPAQIQQKVLQKILEKVFLAKKCAQYKTSHTYVFELPDKKNIGMLFSKNELFFLIHFKYWYYIISLLGPPCLSCHICQISPWPTETLFQRNLHHVLHCFPYFVLPHSTTRHNYWMYQIKC